jgi:hypothetical protein
MRTLPVAALLVALAAVAAAPPAARGAEGRQGTAPPKGAAPPVPAGADPVDPLEKELTALGKRLDALSSELDRAADMASAPVATSVTLEIAGGKGAAAPTGYRLLVDGRVEEERDFGRVERELFSREEGASPLVVRVPVLPGAHTVRIDLSGAGWKAAPSSEVAVTTAKGDTPSFRLRLGPPAAQGGDPVLRLEKALAP